MEKRTIEIQAKTGAAETDLQKIASILEGIADKMDSAADSIDEGFKDIKKGAEDTKKSIFSFGNLFKAGGVFALAEKALGFVTEAFKNTQVGADLLQVSQEALSRVMNDFFTFLSDNIGTVTGYLKSIFEDPRTAISNLIKTIKENLIERINSAIEVFGFLGQAISAVFKGDFDAAAEAAKNAGKEMVDVFTGVDNTFDKTADSIINYGKEIITASQNSVKLQREAEKLEAVNQGLIESYDIQAEGLRQIRDDETKSIDDRLAANEELKTVLEEQEKVMKANAQAIVDAAQARFDSTGLQEDEIALIQAKNELAAVEARVTGMMSEQLTNENSLRKEKLELMNELQLIGKSDIEREQAEAAQLRDQRIGTIEREISDEKMKAELLLAVEKEYNDTLKQITEDAQAERKANQDIADAEELKAKKAVADAMAMIEQQNIDNIAAGFQLLGQLAGENKALQAAALIGESAVGVAKTIINTQSANAAALAQGASLAISTAGASLAAAKGIVAANNVAAGLSIAANVAATAQGLAALGEGGSPKKMENPKAATPPAFNVVGAAPENQLAETIGQKEQTPIKAFVVSNEVSSQQELDRNITEEASIG
tara:strand:- start:3864 stop:5666 length:1803 start_codon:yes stop_codon:yes gene_type:complete